MKQITITVPDNCELKQDGNTYTIIEKEKLDYDIISDCLMEKGSVVMTFNILSTLKQSNIIIAFIQLMNVAKYLNGDWQPNWNVDEPKYIVCYSNKHSQLYIDSTYRNQINNVVFKSEELAKQAIEILGEETIKLALCTDY